MKKLTTGRVLCTVVLIGTYCAMFLATGDPMIAIICTLAAIVEAGFVGLYFCTALLIILGIFEVTDAAVSFGVRMGLITW